MERAKNCLTSLLILGLLFSCRAKEIAVPLTGLTSEEILGNDNSGGSALVNDEPAAPVDHAALTTIKLDSSFGESKGFALARVPGVAAYANALALQNDGKVIIAGTGYKADVQVFVLQRFTAEGIPDNDFNGNGTVISAIGASDDEIMDIAVQPDGKIVAVGFSAYNDAGRRQMAIIRYTQSGALDSRFGKGGIVTLHLGDDSEARAVLVDNAGKILIAGYASDTSGLSTFALVRLTAEGKPDATFGKKGIVTTVIDRGEPSVAQALLLMEDGKILIAGYSASSGAFACYTAHGVLAADFGSRGILKLSNSMVSSLALTKEQKIIGGLLIPESKESDVFALARITKEGALDAAFGKGGYFISTRPATAPAAQLAEANKVVVHSDGNIYFAGSSYEAAFNITVAVLGRVSSSGQLDTNFGKNGFAVVSVSDDDEVAGVAIDSAGKLLMGGLSEMNGNAALTIFKAIP